MQQNISGSLVKITKGTGIIFFGSLFGLFLAFLSRLLLVRCGTESEYGIYSLGLAVVGICCTVATLGLNQGVTRNIAHSRGKNDIERINSFISASVWLALLASTILSLVLFFTSGIIANYIFNSPTLMLPL